MRPKSEVDLEYKREVLAELKVQHEILTQLRLDVAAVGQEMETTRDRLFGNRQPGELDKIRADTAEGVQKAIDEATRVDGELRRVERRITYISSVAAGVGTIMGMFGKRLIYTLTGWQL